MPNKKEEKDNFDLEKARKTVLDEIGEERKEKKESRKETNMTIDGNFLEDVKKSRESLKAKMPAPVKIQENKTTRQKKEKPDSKEIEKTLDNIAKYGNLKNEQNIKIDNVVIDKKLIKNNRRIGRKIKVEEKAEEKKETPGFKVPKNQAKPAEIKTIKPVRDNKQHPAIKILVFTILISICLFIIFYSAFALLLTRFNVDNREARFIAKYLPVPALISRVGMIEYYDYKDILKNTNISPDKLKFNLVRILIKNSRIKAGEQGELKVWSLVE